MAPPTAAALAQTFFMTSLGLAGGRSPRRPV